MVHFVIKEKVQTVEKLKQFSGELKFTDTQADLYCLESKECVIKASYIMPRDVNR